MLIAEDKGRQRPIADQEGRWWDHAIGTTVETYYSTKEEAKEAQLKGYKSKIIRQIDYSAVSKEDVVLKCTHLLLHRQTSFDRRAWRDSGAYVYIVRWRVEGVRWQADPFGRWYQCSVPSRTQRAYPVLHLQLEVCKQEQDRLEDGKVRWLAYFRALNQALKSKVYPLPRIQDILQRRIILPTFSKKRAEKGLLLQNHSVFVGMEDWRWDFPVQPTLLRNIWRKFWTAWQASKVSLTTLPYSTLTTWRRFHWRRCRSPR